MPCANVRVRPRIVNKLLCSLINWLGYQLKLGYYFHDSDPRAFDYNYF
jgi:hypothetical protein